MKHSAAPPGPEAAAEARKEVSAAAEELFLQVFSLQDTPSKQDIKALAAKAGCEEEQVRAYFGRLRGSVRQFQQRAQRKTGSAEERSATAAGPTAKQAADGGKASRAAASAASLPAVAAAGGGSSGDEAEEAPSSPAAAVQTAVAGREAGLRKLGLLTDESGGLRDSSVTRQFTQLMAHAEAPTLRCAMLHALLVTKRPGARIKLVHHAGFLSALEGWLAEAEGERQVTLLLLLLQVLEGTPLPPAATRPSGVLAKAAARLSRDKHPRLAAAAQRLSERWQQATPADGAGTAAGAAPGAGGSAAAAGAGGGAGAAPQAPQGTEGGARKPSATELVHLTALGRKSLFGKLATAPIPAHLARTAAGAASSAGGEAEAGGAGTPRAPGAGGAPTLRRLLSEGASAGAAASPRAPAAAAGGAPLRSMLSGGGSARAARPLSADDIRKQKERQRASAALQSLTAGGAGALGAPPAKRPRLEQAAGATPLPAPPAPATQQPPQQQQQQQPAAVLVHGPGRGGAGGQPASPPAAAAGRAGAPGHAAGVVVPAAAPPASSAAGGWGAGPAAAGGGGLAAEMAACAALYEQDRQRRAAARRVQLVQEYAAMDEAAGRLASMRPGLPAYPPPPPLLLPPLDLPMGRGEESTEAAQQRAQLATAQRAVYPHPLAIAPSAAEPAFQEPASEAATPLVPFNSTDPEEQQMQTERLLRDGVRLPQYVMPG